MSNVPILLCQYFNDRGGLVETIYVIEPGEPLGVEDVRLMLRRPGIEEDLGRLKATAAATGSITTLETAAMAVEALLSDVVAGGTSQNSARQVYSVSVNYNRAVSVVDVIPTIHAMSGECSVYWAREILKHLDLPHPRLN